MSKKPPKTQQEIDDERIARQHKRALLRNGWGSAKVHRRSYNAFSATHRQIPYEKKVDESPDIG